MTDTTRTLPALPSAALETPALPLALHLPAQIVADAMTDAIEGRTGSSYWMESIRLRTPDKRALGAEWWYAHAPLYLRSDLSIQVRLHEERSVYEITALSIRRGLEAMARESGQHFGDLIAQKGDGITADVFLQYATFGEVRYG